MTNELARIRRWLVARPVTIAIAALITVLFIVTLIVERTTHAHPAPTLTWLATGHDAVITNGRWWTVFSYVFMSWGWLQFLASLALIFGAIGFFEGRMPRRMLLAAIPLSALAGAAIGIGFQMIGVATGLPLLGGTSKGFVADPITLVIGICAIGSAWLGPIGRRRTRVLLFVDVLVLLVYVGNVSVLYKVGAAIVGLIVGELAHPTERRRGWRPSTVVETRALLAWSIAALGIGPMLALLVPHSHSLAAPLTSILPISQFEGTDCDIWRVTAECVSQRASLIHLNPFELVISSLPWVAFIVIAWGLARGQRFAAEIGVLLNLLVVALLIWFWGIAPLQFRGMFGANPIAARADAVETVLQLVVIVLIHLAAAIALFTARHSFPVRPTPRAVKRFSSVVVGAAVALVIAFAIFASSDMEPFEPHPNFWEALLAGPERLLPPLALAVNPSAMWPTSATAEVVATLFSPVFNVICIVAMWRTLQSGNPQLASKPQPEVLAALKRGGTSLSYLGIWDGNEYWVDESGDCVAFRNVQGVAITVGGPFGGAADPVDVLQRFARAAERAGLEPCAYSVPGEWRERLEAIGWSTLEVAEESVVDLASWSTTGKKWQDIRTAINRSDRAGIEVEWSSWDDLTVRRAREIRDLNERWVGDKPLPEMGFTLGGVAELAQPETLLGIATSPDGTIEGVTSWLPTWRDGQLVGRTLDFMRRNPDGGNGVMEMLIARAAERFRDEGLEWLSLSGAPLASTTKAEDTANVATIDRLLDQVGRLLEPVYGFRSLLGFKRKFQPQMRPLIMAYPDAAQLPNIGLAISAAYLPGIGVGEAVQALRSQRVGAGGDSSARS